MKGAEFGKPPKAAVGRRPLVVGQRERKQQAISRPAHSPPTTSRSASLARGWLIACCLLLPHGRVLSGREPHATLRIGTTGADTDDGLRAINGSTNATTKTTAIT